MNIKDLWQPLILCDVDCNYNHFIQLIKNGITDLILLGLLATVGVLVFAGFKLITSQGNPGKMKEAREMLITVVKGFVIMLVAWLIIYTISVVLLDPQYIQLTTPPQN